MGNNRLILLKKPQKKGIAYSKNILHMNCITCGRKIKKKIADTKVYKKNKHKPETNKQAVTVLDHYLQAAKEDPKIILDLFFI